MIHEWKNSNLLTY